MTISVQIKTKRECEISFYFIKVNFCLDLDRKMRAELVGPNVDKMRVYNFEIGLILLLKPGFPHFNLQPQDSFEM